VYSFSNITPISNFIAAVCEVFSNAYPYKGVPIKTLHQLITKFRDTGSVHDRCSLNDRTTEIMAISFSSSSSAATAVYGCKNLILSLASSFCQKGVMCSS
jgi:hypothetical protein